MKYSQHTGESTQWVTVKCQIVKCHSQILGCNIVLDAVRNSRYNWHPTPLNYTVGDRRWSCMTVCFSIYLTAFHAVACAGSVVLTQTHPAAPYVCRTGNITLRCQYGGVENVLVVLWAIGNEAGTTNPSTIPGHTVLPRTTTYQEVVVEDYTSTSQ